jgi:hypothetical protein
MGHQDKDDKRDGKQTSTEKQYSKEDAKEHHKAPKQHADYSRLEGGERARISADDLSELISENDIEALKKYGGVKVLSFEFHFFIYSNK